MEKNDLTLEKLEVVKRLSAVESKLDVYLEKMHNHDEKDEKMFLAIKDNIDTLNKLMIGDGTRKGVIERINNIEGVFNHVKAIWLAMIGFLVEFLFRTFFHHPKGG